MLESNLHNIITSDASFSALADDRLYPVILPGDPVLPAVTYQRITTRRDYTTTGPVGLSRVRMQFDAWANGYAECKQLHTALLAILENRDSYAGTFPDGTRIDSIMLNTVSDGYAPDARIYRVSIDFFVYVTE